MLTDILIIMNEPKNIKINLMVTPSIWKHLQKVDNYSAYVRKLIERDHRKDNKKLDI